MFFRSHATPPKPPEPDRAEQPPTDPEELRHAIAVSFLAMREGLAPAFDAADGMRADLQSRGWSPQSAELLTLTWLQRVLINATPLTGGTK